ncbi:EAL domain-containing protein [Effusibacillus consociatus]|uniref:EAL domain-containing protein n=1 Tax=Effusibacillus consociatus TaxID=1117041 RepID=A0ABV9PY69_9BACL
MKSNANATKHTKIMNIANEGECNQPARSSNSDSTFESSVEKVLKQRSLRSVYQPIIHHKQNSVFAHEALSRPLLNGKPLNPEEWFRKACAYGLTVEADLLAVESALRNFTPVDSSYLFVNVMPTSLGQNAFLYALEDLLREISFSPQDLVFELTEFFDTGFQQIKQTIATLRSYGIRIAIDDVEIENSSLRAIIELEPDFIKVDRSLIQGIAVSEQKQRIVAALLDYIGSREALIAEGVETHEDFKALIKVGVLLSQGYYWSSLCQF